MVTNLKVVGSGGSSYSKGVGTLYMMHGVLNLREAVRSRYRWFFGDDLCQLGAPVPLQLTVSAVNLEYTGNSVRSKAHHDV